MPRRRCPWRTVGSNRTSDLLPSPKRARSVPTNTLVIRSEPTYIETKPALILPLPYSLGHRLSRTRHHGTKANDRQLLGSVLPKVHQTCRQSFP
jgi:hypothetical protein